MALYFGSDVDLAIVDFQKSKDQNERNKIFSDRIRPAMEKLIHNQIYLYRFYKIDDPEVLKTEALSNLYETIPKFDFSKGKKAFSYFNVVLKNWFVGRIRQLNKRKRQEDGDKDIFEKDILSTSSYESDVIDREFMASLFEDMEGWRRRLSSKQEIQVLDAFSILLKNPDSIEIYNKKAVLFYLKEITKLNTKKISHTLNQLREMYKSFKQRYNDGEEEKII